MATLHPKTSIIAMRLLRTRRVANRHGIAPRASLLRHIRGREKVRLGGTVCGITDIRRQFGDKCVLLALQRNGEGVTCRP
jgi:hypothetical protein